MSAFVMLLIVLVIIVFTVLVFMIPFNIHKLVKSNQALVDYSIKQNRLVDEQNKLLTKLLEQGNV